MGNCFGYFVRRNNLPETRSGNESGRKLAQLQQCIGDGRGVRHGPIFPPVERSPPQGRLHFSVQPFTQHNIENAHDPNLQRAVQLDLRLQSKNWNSNHPIPCGDVRRIKLLISSRELSELLNRENCDGDGNIEPVLLQKLQSNGVVVETPNGRGHRQRSEQSWRPSLSDIPEVIT